MSRPRGRRDPIRCRMTSPPDWTRFRVREIDLSLLYAALEIKWAHGLSYWDSAIVAAARALGCGELYSEDMSDEAGSRVL